MKNPYDQLMEESTDFPKFMKEIHETANAFAALHGSPQDSLHALRLCMAYAF